MPSRKTLTLGESRVEEPTDRKALVKLFSAIRRVRFEFLPAVDLVSRSGGLHKRGGNWYGGGYQLGVCALVLVDLDQVTSFPLTSARGEKQPTAAYRHVLRKPDSSCTRTGSSLADRSKDLASIVTHRIIGDRVI